MPADIPAEEESSELPPYRAVLVVDTKDLGSNPDVTQAAMADAIPGILTLAFERAGLGHVWQDALFPHNTGDGFGIGFDTRYLPAVVSRFFDTLQDVLAEHDMRARKHRRGGSLRMRASLNIGPVRELGADSESAVVGSAVITTHRLLDAAPVRNVLTRSDPEQTYLSVALSQRVFDDVLASGYATLPPSQVVPTAVKVKEFTGTVYLYVPNPSGDLLIRGIGDDPDYRTELDNAKAELDIPRHGSTANTISGGTHSGTTIQVGNLHGGLHNRDA